MNTSTTHSALPNDTAYDAAIDYARKLGAKHGTNAAGWYVQDMIGGRASGDPRRAAQYTRRLRRVLENGSAER